MFVNLRVVDGSISIHALLAESDTWARGSRVTYVEFLSTLSLRRATAVKLTHSAQAMYFYPRSPCGERLRETVPGAGHINNFYPRSPCGERPEIAKTSKAVMNFYPRSPCGERPG